MSDNPHGAGKRLPGPSRPQLPPPLTVVELARLGGLACAASRTPRQRQLAARRAVAARWRRYRERLAAGVVDLPEGLSLPAR